MLVQERIVERLDTLFEGRTTTIAKDLKLNLRKLLTESALPPEEAAPALVATAASAQDDRLLRVGVDWMQDLGFSDADIQEARESAAIMAMLNTYYKFKGLVPDASAYGPAGLRMTSLARPALGKDRFEMLAFAVSVINGCPSCIGSHEKALIDAGVGYDKLHDLARLGAVVKAASQL
jgi:alkyl hydroperoxide reductase subunit D